MCFNKGCESYRKSIRRNMIEGAFAVQPEKKGFEPRNYLYTFSMLGEKIWSELYDGGGGGIRTHGGR